MILNPFLIRTQSRIVISSTAGFLSCITYYQYVQWKHLNCCILWYRLFSKAYREYPAIVKGEIWEKPSNISNNNIIEEHSCQSHLWSVNYVLRKRLYRKLWYTAPNYVTIFCTQHLCLVIGICSWQPPNYLKFPPKKFDNNLELSCYPHGNYIDTDTWFYHPKSHLIAFLLSLFTGYCPSRVFYAGPFHNSCSQRSNPSRVSSPASHSAFFFLAFSLQA